jgi:hypothetical protein
MKVFFQRRLVFLALYIILSVALLLSACIVASTPSSEPASPIPQAASSQEESPTPLAELDEFQGLDTPSPIVSPSSEVLASDSPTPEPAITITSSLDLHATDPGTVTLAAGKPQLIEFFAFW